MASRKRHKTKYAGVYYVISSKGEKVYYARYRKDNKSVDEKVGHQYLNDMTPAKASGIRADRMIGKVPNNAEKRQLAKQEASVWTAGKLWKRYSATLKEGGSSSEKANWKNHLKPTFDKKEPKDLVKLDVDRIRIDLLKKLKPQTVRHVVALLRRIINYGADQGYVAPLHFKITLPRIDNITTEDLTQEQLKKLMKELLTTRHKTVSAIMRIALFSGMRKTEILSLKWSDIDTHRGFIFIREPKSGTSQKIPLNENVKAVIDSLPHDSETWLFPAPKKEGHRTDISRPAREIRDNAGIPETFRPMHGLRHLYATTLANSGRVDMYQLQKLLTHKTPEMTQRYAHLRDKALRDVGGVVDDVFEKAVNGND